MCPTLVHGGGRCPEHRRQRHRRIDRRRGSAHSRGYDWQWSKPGGIRDQALAREPLCRSCTTCGDDTPATEVDHIDGDPRNNRRENLRPLCKSCHSTLTAKQQAFGRKANWFRERKAKRMLLPWDELGVGPDE